MSSPNQYYKTLLRCPMYLWEQLTIFWRPERLFWNDRFFSQIFLERLPKTEKGREKAKYMSPKMFYSTEFRSTDPIEPKYDEAAKGSFRIFKKVQSCSEIHTLVAGDNFATARKAV